MSQLKQAPRHRRAGLALLVSFAVCLATTAMLLAPAGAVTSSNAAVHADLTFTSPITGLSDGSTLNFHVSVNSGNGFASSITSHICKQGSLITNDTNFGYQTGTRCVRPGGVQAGTGLTGADYEVDSAPLSGSNGGTNDSGNLSHHVGTGTVAWTNENSPVPTSLTCDSTHPCDLVVRADTTEGLVFFTEHLTFAAAATNPGTPVFVSATGGNATISLDWDAPAFDGNRPIDKYVVTQTVPAGASIDVTGGATSLLISSGLTNGTPYTFTVVAHNTGGFSSVTPLTMGPVTPSLAFRNVQQPITVTRPAGDLVMTQACNGAPDIYPDGTLPAPYDPAALPGPVTYGAATQTGCTVALGAAHLIKTGNGAGQFFTASHAINEVTVVDARDGDPGWEALGSVTPFVRQNVGPVAQFSGNNLGWAPAASDTGALHSDDTDYDQVVTPGSAVTPKVTGTGIVAGVGLGTTPQRLAIAGGGAGLGIAKLNAVLNLLIPINAKSGDYQSILTITVA